MFTIPDTLRHLSDHVTLIAVSKQQPQEKIQSALDHGLRHFGENRVQEAYRHFHELKPNYHDLTLHLIGPLQSNKAAEAVALFDVIHTIDREKIAHVLKAEMQKQQRFLPCFIQVNTGNEPQKAGIAPGDVKAFFDFCTCGVDLDIVGLMCIPPVDQETSEHFRLLKSLGDSIGVTQFSMGMSDDYTQAIEAGATHIRVGSALFGNR